MKLKIDVDLEIPAHLKWALRIGLPLAVLGAAAVAYASVPKTWKDGDVLSATDLNAVLASLDARMTTMEANGPSGFRAEMTVPHTVQNGVMLFDHVLFDISKEYQPTTGVFAPKTAGYYFVECGLQFNTLPDGATFAIGIQRNGANAGGFDEQTGAGSIGASIAASGILELAANDSVTCTVFLTSGSTPVAEEVFTPRDFFTVYKLR